MADVTPLTDRALSTLNDAAREQLLIEAVTMASDNVAIIPLYQVINIWASRTTLTFEPRRDQLHARGTLLHALGREQGRQHARNAAEQ